MRAPLIISAALHALLACFVVTLRVVDPPIDESVGLMLVSAHTARDRRVVRVRRPTMLRSRKDGGPVSLAVSRSLPVRRATAPPRAAAPIHVPREHAPVAEFQASPTPTASPTGPSEIAGDSRDDGYRADGAAAARSRPTAKHPRRGRSGLSMSMDSGSPTSPSAAITTPRAIKKLSPKPRASQSLLPRPRAKQSQRPRPRAKQSLLPRPRAK